MDSTKALITLIDQSLLLTDVKKSLLKKQVPFWSEAQKTAIKNYLGAESSMLAKSLIEADPEKLSANDLNLLGKTLSKTKHKMLGCEERMEKETDAPALENLLNTL